MRDISTTNENDGAMPAEEVYLQFLVRKLHDESLEFSSFCEEHPDQADDLRALHSDHEALGQAREKARTGESPRESALREIINRLRRPRGFTGRLDREGHIGTGGQGEVHEARELILERSVAIKTLRRDLLERIGQADSPGAVEMLARFLAEAQITAQLDHPGIVAVHELGIDDEQRPYFTMTRVRGMELSEVFRLCGRSADEWPLVRCVGLLQRVCETMAFAHSRGVVHRDLKPANVMVGSYGEVYVMDWGLARVLEEEADRPTNAVSTSGGGPRVHTVRVPGHLEGPNLLMDTLPSENLGTVFYISPEVAAAGAAGACPAADVYAVGAMLYQLLGGQPPYWKEEAGVRHADVLAQVQAGPPAPLERVAPAAPPELVSICERAMARQVEDRYEDMTALAEDLRAFLEDRVVGAHAAGPWAELRMWVRRNRAFAGALLAMIVIAVSSLLVIAGLESRARNRLDLEADLYRLPYLEQRELALWPEVPANIAAYESWLATGEALAGRAAIHADRLSHLRESALSGDPQLDESWRFATPAQQLKHDALVEAVSQIENFTGPEGLLSEIRGRLEWAQEVEELTVHSQRAAWERAGDAVKSSTGPYSGWELAPQLGLIPLGADPRSGLQEFAHPRSGRVPVRGAEGLEIDDTTGLVFVLIPGGRFTIGAQPDDPDAPGFDPNARPEEAPAHEVELAPFLVSKYEMTQGQWARMTRYSPSFVGDGEVESPPAGGHPVEGASWEECSLWLARFGMSLPTEAQWEYAARAGSQDPYLDTQLSREVDAAFNLADATVLRAGHDWPQARGMDWLDDGFVRHAPVGSFRPNDFGLHDTLGNVWEWCLDPPGAYTLGVRVGDGLRQSEPSTTCIARGGGFINNAAYSRVSIRDMGRSKNFDSSYHGLRPVWLLTLP